MDTVRMYRVEVLPRVRCPCLFESHLLWILAGNGMAIKPLAIDVGGGANTTPGALAK